MKRERHLNQHIQKRPLQKDRRVFPRKAMQAIRGSFQNTRGGSHGVRTGLPSERVPPRRRDQAAWTMFLWKLLKTGQNKQALKFYAKMRKDGLKLSSYTIVAALKACSGLQDLGTARQIHADAVARGLESDVHVGTMLLDMYAKCGHIVDARSVFEKMPQRNVVSWTAMILGYAQMEECEVALELYTQMRQEGVSPNDRTYVGVLKACSNLATQELKDRAKGMHVKARSLEQVKSIHCNIIKDKFESDVYVGTMLVDAYAKCGTLVDARSVFEKMPHRNVISWTAMITGYAHMDEGDVVLQLYARMQQEGIVPNDRTFVSALKACGSVLGLERGKKIHAQISELGAAEADPFVVSALVDMYGKCGSMQDAQKVFDAWPSRDTVIWNALIAGYARQGDSQPVFDSFERMKQEDVQPNDVTFLGLLTVCSHVGLVDKGMKYFEIMSVEYGISPSIDHYTCMLDLFGRAGQVESAVAMVRTMPFQPDGVAWNAVLSACRKWDKVQLGREAFEHAVSLDKMEARAYLVMEHIYAAAHMENKANEINAVRAESGTLRQPGESSWTDTLGRVHKFVVEDQEHPQSQEIYARLLDLLVKMEAEGQAANFDSVAQSVQ